MNDENRKQIKGVPCDKRDFQGSQSGNETAEHVRRALEAAKEAKKQAGNDNK